MYLNNHLWNHLVWFYLISYGAFCEWKTDILFKWLHSADQDACHAHTLKNKQTNKQKTTTNEQTKKKEKTTTNKLKNLLF